MSTAGERMSRRAVTGAPGPIEETAVAASTTAPTTTAPTTTGPTTTALTTMALTTTVSGASTLGVARTVTVAMAHPSATGTVTDRTTVTGTDHAGHSDFVMSATRR
jgi:hypothetical protein